MLRDDHERPNPSLAPKNLRKTTRDFLSENIDLVYDIWMFPKIKIVVPQNGWFIMVNPIKIDDLGVPLFLETPISTSFSGELAKIQIWATYHKENQISIYPLKCKKNN